MTNCIANPPPIPHAIAHFCAALLKIGVATLLAGGAQDVAAHPQIASTVFCGNHWQYGAIKARLVYVGALTFTLDDIKYIAPIKFYEDHIPDAEPFPPYIKSLPNRIKLRIHLADPPSFRAPKIKGKRWPKRHHDGEPKRKPWITQPEDSPLRVLARQLASDLRNLQANPCAPRGSSGWPPPQRGPLAPCQIHPTLSPNASSLGAHVCELQQASRT